MEKYSHKIVRKFRIRIPDIPGGLGKIAQEFGRQGVILGDITKVHITTHFITRDIAAFFNNEIHFRSVLKSLRKLKGYKIISIIDEVLSLHDGGKISVQSTKRMDTLNDLRMLYTPGVAQVCNYIVKNPLRQLKNTPLLEELCALQQMAQPY